MMTNYKKANKVLKQTSRTFYIPISNLPDKLNAPVMSAYLCMRAIDEIEDDPNLPKQLKMHLLKRISEILLEENTEMKLTKLFEQDKGVLKDVTLDLNEWIEVCPLSIRQTILQSTSEMAAGMAKWVEQEWQVHSEADLDDYTYYVAGLVGTMLSDIWFWSDDVTTDKELAVAFGRGLQAVNIARNREEDLQRGVDFFPAGWQKDDMIHYAKKNLTKADQYTEDLPVGPIRMFCSLPLQLAHGTLDALIEGKEKLSRTDVLKIASKVLKKSF